MCIMTHHTTQILHTNTNEKIIVLLIFHSRSAGPKLDKAYLGAADSVKDGVGDVWQVCGWLQRWCIPSTMNTGLQCAPNSWAQNDQCHPKYSLSILNAHGLMDSNKSLGMLHLVEDVLKIHMNCFPCQPGIPSPIIELVIVASGVWYHAC